MWILTLPNPKSSIININISLLKIIEMILNDNIKKISIKSAFENCFDLESFNITGLKSLNKLFYETKNLENVNLEIFKKKQY